MELEAKLLRAGNINRLNIFSNSDNTETNEEKKQERKITKKTFNNDARKWSKVFKIRHSL